MFDRFILWLESHITLTWNEKLAREEEAATQEIQEARTTIMKHWYLEHMALHKLDAMEAWRHGNRRGGTPELLELARTQALGARSADGAASAPVRTP